MKWLVFPELSYGEGKTAVLGSSVFWPDVVRKWQIHGKTDKRTSEQSFLSVHLFMKNIIIVQCPSHERTRLKDLNSFNKFTALLLRGFMLGTGDSMDLTKFQSYP